MENPITFCFWLNGYLANVGHELTPEQLDEIRKKLDTALKAPPPQFPGMGGPPNPYGMGGPR
jgi:hypothetical protein